MVGGLGCWVRFLRKRWIWVRWLVSGDLSWRIKREEFGEELGLGDYYSSVGFVGKVESEKLRSNVTS